MFRFSADDLQTLMAGGTLTTLNGLVLNGTVTVWGATTLADGGDWRAETAGARFFKAVLTR